MCNNGGTFSSNIFLHRPLSCNIWAWSDIDREIIIGEHIAYFLKNILQAWTCYNWDGWPTVRWYMIAVFNQAIQANSAFSSLHGRAKWVLAMVMATTTEENDEFCVTVDPLTTNCWCWHTDPIGQLVCFVFYPCRLKNIQGMSFLAMDVALCGIFLILQL